MTEEGIVQRTSMQNEHECKIHPWLEKDTPALQLSVKVSPLDRLKGAAEIQLSTLDRERDWNVHRCCPFRPIL